MKVALTGNPNSGKNSKQAWDSMACFYDISMMKDKKMYKEIVYGIKKSTMPEGKLLEIGTGTGLIALKLDKDFNEIEAIDYSEKMIEIARKKALKQKCGNIKFRVGNVFKLDYEDHIFDYVVIANVLHIIPEPEKAMKEIKRILKADGILFAPTFVHKGSKKAKIFEKVAAVKGFKTYSQWSGNDYIKFLENNKFKVIKSNYMKASFPSLFTACKTV